MPRDRSGPGSFGVGMAALLLAAAALGGCQKDSPESLLKSAHEYVAKKDHRAAAIQLRNLIGKQPENGEAHDLLAVSALELGEFGAAEKALRTALKLGRPPDAVYPRLARAMLAQGEFRQLVAELGNISSADAATQAEIKAAVGEAYLAMGSVDQARQAFSAALAGAPGSPRARAGLARITAAEGDAAGAMKVAEEILSANADFPQALALKADILASQARSDEAMAVLEALVKVAPYDGHARFALVSLLISGNKLDRAALEIAAMKKALPHDLQAFYLEALLALRSGDPARARDAIRTVLKPAPDHAPSLLLAATAEFQLGALATAEDYLRKVVAASPDNLYARNLLANVYLRKGQPKKAEEVMEPALNAAPGDPTVLGTAGEVAFANGRLAEAAGYYEKALALKKDNTALRTRLAQVRLAKGETERALDDLQAISGLDQGGYQADLSLVTASLNRGDYGRALQAVATLEKKQPNNPLTHNIKGVIYIASKDAKNARASFEKALGLQFDYLPAAINLAKLDLLDRNPEAAKKRFETILAKQPNNDTALLALAQSMMSNFAPPDEVRKILERAVAANKSSAAARVALVTFLLQNGDARAAQSAARDAAGAMPGDTEILDTLGQAQRAAGDINQAIATFSQLASAVPESYVPLMRLAAAQFEARRYADAVQSLRKALEIKPDLLDAQRDIVAVHLAAGQPEEALREARAVQKARPGQALGYAMEGDVLAAQNKLAEASRMYAEGLRRQPVPALAVRHHQMLRARGTAAEAAAMAAAWQRENPNDGVFRLYLAANALQDKDYADAARRYKELLVRQPENVVALNNLAWALGEMNDPAALGFADKAYAIAPANPGVLDTYGWLLVAKGDAARGTDLLARAVAGSPRSADMRLHLAKALLKAGNKAGAKSQLEALLGLDDKTPLKAEAQALLQSL